MSTSQIVYAPLQDFINGNSGSRLSADLSRVVTLAGGQVTAEAPSTTCFADTMQLAVNGDGSADGRVSHAGYLASALLSTATTVALNANLGAVLVALGGALDTYMPVTPSNSVSANGNNPGARDDVLKKLREFLAGLQELV